MCVQFKSVLGIQFNSTGVYRVSALEGKDGALEAT